jgi:hypothetical protein
MVSFVSRLWGGCASDRHIVQSDEFIPKLSQSDVLMADEGFTIDDLLPAGIALNVPPRVSAKCCLHQNFSKLPILPQQE